MATLPGHIGISLVGDKSYEFYKDAVHFVNRRMFQFDARVFVIRFLNKPTVFVASNKGTKELLQDCAQHMEMGYRPFMHQIYGDSILFSDGEEATQLRQVLCQLLSNSKESFQEITSKLTDVHLQDIEDSVPTAAYAVFKKLTTAICLHLFLNISVDESSELAETIVSLTTMHWHGIIAMPFNVKVPGFGHQSTYGKALLAKEKLLAIIRERLEDTPEGFPLRAKEADFPEGLDAAHHLLLFSSALVPKALASLLTSFVVVTAGQALASLLTSFVVVTAGQTRLLVDARKDPESLEYILYEVLRLWPPLPGGRRVAKEDFTLCGYHVPKGHALVYMAYHAQRDPAVFNEPDNFLPQRWKEKNADDKDKLFLFGSGSRDCIGRHVVWDIFHLMVKGLMAKYYWRCDDDIGDLPYKWLPVTRPRDDVMVTFTARFK